MHQAVAIITDFDVLIKRQNLNLGPQGEKNTICMILGFDSR